MAGGATYASEAHSLINPQTSQAKEDSHHCGQQPSPALADTDAIARRLAHAFPWTPAASVHIVLAIKR